MAGKKKFYVVKRGVKPGIYTSWDECEAQVSGFSGPIYRGFQNQVQAKQYWLKPLPPRKARENESNIWVEPNTPPTSAAQTNNSSSSPDARTGSAVVDSSSPASSVPSTPSPGGAKGAGRKRAYSNESPSQAKRPRIAGFAALSSGPKDWETEMSLGEILELIGGRRLTHKTISSSQIKIAVLKECLE